jgi:ATP-dependent Clp protease ATP-binding subunit ClpA
MDASNMLKPMLARGELHTVSADTRRNPEHRRTQRWNGASRP